MKGPPRNIAVFDFISHDTMHLPFNEGYLRMLVGAAPDAKIRCYARAGHIENLRSQMKDLPQLSWGTVSHFAARFGLSRHNPISGIAAAGDCLADMASIIDAEAPDFVAVLGFEGFLARGLRKRASAFGGAHLHLILHGTLGDNLLWRSRNPLIRTFDMISEMRSPLPRNMTIVVPELGISQRLAELFPHLQERILTLEHPILERDWIDSESVADRKSGLTVSFLGNARASKGFGEFARLAIELKSTGIRFECIGHGDPTVEKFDLSGLHRRPSLTHVERETYIRLIKDTDLVCLPFSQANYGLTASGTLCDAIAMLKPIVAVKTGPLVAVEDRYGPYGQLFDTLDDLAQHLRRYATGLDSEMHHRWQETLRKIRLARRPQSLSQTYFNMDAG